MVMGRNVRNVLPSVPPVHNTLLASLFDKYFQSQFWEKNKNKKLLSFPIPALYPKT